jgi:hypothetical protein
VLQEAADPAAAVMALVTAAPKCAWAAHVAAPRSAAAVFIPAAEEMMVSVHND